jgi:hypothetical protein
VRHPLAHDLHHARDVERQVLRLAVLFVEQILVGVVLDQPGELGVEVGHRRGHDRPALGGHHGKRHRPVGAALARQDAAPAHGFAVPVQHQHLLEARRDALMHGHRDPLALAGFARVAESGQRGDRGVAAGDHEVELAERLERRGVRRAGGGHGAAQRARHEIRREQVAPWAIVAERRDGHVHERRISGLRGGQVDRAGGEGARAGEYQVRTLDEALQLMLAGRRFGRHGEHATAGAEECVPERVAVGGMRAARPQRIAFGRFRADDVRAEVGQQFGAIDRAFVRQVDHAQSGECAFVHVFNSPRRIACYPAFRSAVRRRRRPG